MSEPLHSFFTDEEIKEMNVDVVQDFDARSWCTDDDQDFDTKSWGTGDDNVPLLIADYTGAADEETSPPAGQATAPTQQSTTEVRDRWQAFYADLDRRATRIQRPTLNLCKYPFKHPYHSTEGVIPSGNLITYVDKDMGGAGVSCSMNPSQPSPCTNLTYADLRPGSFITISTTATNYREYRTSDDPLRPAIFNNREATKNGVRGQSLSYDALVVRVYKGILIVVPVGGERRPNTAQDQVSAVPDDKVVKLYESDFPLFPNSCVYLSMPLVLTFDFDIRLHGVLSDEGMTIFRAAWLRTFDAKMEDAGKVVPALLKSLKDSRLGRLGRRLTLGKSKDKSS